MKEKKHIDQLFKERFEQFEPTPSPRVWENIQAQLVAKKEDRKVIPLWWRLGGVAALLALVFMVGSLFFNTSEISDGVVTTEEIPVPEASDTNKAISPSEVSIPTPVASEEVSTRNNASQINQTTIPSSHAITTSEPVSDNTKKQIPENTKQTSIASEEKITHSATNTSEILQKRPKNTTQTGITKNNGAAVAKITSSSTPVETKGLDNSTTVPNNPILKKEMEVIDAVKIVEETSVERKTEPNKKSLIEEIENLKKEEEAVALVEEPAQRWNVAPNIAPVYYSSLSNGSSVDPMFEDNTQGGNTSISYGVNISYNITDRFSVRSGISNVDLSYSTGGVIAAEGPGSVALRGVNHNGTTTILTAFDTGSIPNNSSETNGFGMITPKSGGAPGELNQDISYFEVPLELKYALLNKRFGINVIGGFSTLFLGKNEISVRSGDFESVLGEANNLTSVSFTSNVGLGFGYAISKKFKFNIEPMFKYQLNPYTDSSVNFKPYYVGVYSGLSFQF